MNVLIYLLLLLALPALFGAFKQFSRHFELRRIEEALPSCLISISTLPSTASFQHVLNRGASTNSSAAVLFRHCKELISKGNPVSLAISLCFSGSPIISKTGQLLAKLYTHGNSLLPVVKEFGLELGEMHKAKQQAKADSAMHKYSLLVSTAFLVPLIIGLVYSVSLHAASLFSTQVIPGMLMAINLYLLALSLLCAKFLARQFSTHFYSFFLITAPLSLLVFNAALFFLA